MSSTLSCKRKSYSSGSTSSHSCCFRRRMVTMVCLWQVAIIILSLPHQCYGFTQKHIRGSLSFRYQHLSSLRVASKYNMATENSTETGGGVGGGDGAHDIETILKKETLYEILGSSPMDSRTEIKANYRRLARLAHPDARIGNKENSEENIPDFQDIADAWRVLGNPKTRRKYDRTLRAEQFSQDAQKFADENLEKVAPAVSAILDNVAVPFLRRTTATTWAVAQAAAQGVSKLTNNEKSNTKGGNNNKTTSSSSSEKTPTITDAFASAVEAGQQVSRAIDSMELSEKSAQLEERASSEKERVRQISEELESITQTRLFGTLRSPKFALSSDEAFQVLELLHAAIYDNENDIGVIRRRNTAKQDIERLQEAELKFSEKLNSYEETDDEWNKLLRQQDMSKNVVKQMKIKEIEARRELERAQEAVNNAKAILVSTTNKVRTVEGKVKRSAIEMDKVTNNLTRKQQKVRNTLNKKADELQSKSPKVVEEQGQQKQRSSLSSEPLSEKELSDLRQKELQLMDERRQIESMVTKLEERSQALKARAVTLDEMQKDENSTP